MEEIFKELLYREVGKYAVEAMSDVDFASLVEKTSIKALKEIQEVLLDDSIPERAKAPYIESVLIKYGIEASGYYD